MGGVGASFVIELDPSSDACAGLAATAPGIETPGLPLSLLRARRTRMTDRQARASVSSLAFVESFTSHFCPLWFCTAPKNPMVSEGISELIAKLSRLFSIVKWIIGV